VKSSLSGGNLKVTREKVENSQAFLTVEIEPAEMEEPMEVSYKRIAQKANIPGFRKGKAPRAILEQYVGKASIIEDALKSVVPQAYEQALKEQEIEPFAQPEVEITQTDPVIFKAVVPLAPTVELGDYHSIKMEPEKAEVTEDNVNEVIEELRHQNATWEPVDRPLDYKDLATIDINGKIDEKPYIQRVGTQYQVIKDSIGPAPGFADQIVGMKKGEEKEFDLTFPEDYANTEAAGKKAHFKVKLSEIKAEILPELDDEFVGRISTELKTVDELHEEVRKNLVMRTEDRVKTEFQEKLVEAVIEQSQIDYPPILIEIEINRILNEQARQLQMSGRNLEDYCRSINKTEQQLREELRPIAEKNIMASLVLNKLAEVEHVEVSDVEIDESVNTMASGASQERKEELRKMLDTPQTRQSIKQSILTRKTIECLADIAKSPEKSATGTKKRKQKEEKENE
jgi:trigger factor